MNFTPSGNNVLLSWLGAKSYAAPTGTSANFTWQGAYTYGGSGTLTFTGSTLLTKQKSYKGTGTLNLVGKTVVQGLSFTWGGKPGYSPPAGNLLRFTWMVGELISMNGASTCSMSGGSIYVSRLSSVGGEVTSFASIAVLITSLTATGGTTLSIIDHAIFKSTLTSTSPATVSLVGAAEASASAALSVTGTSLFSFTDKELIYVPVNFSGSSTASFISGIVHQTSLTAVGSESVNLKLYGVVPGGIEAVGSASSNLRGGGINQTSLVVTENGIVYLYTYKQVPAFNDVFNSYYDQYSMVVDDLVVPPQFATYVPDNQVDYACTSVIAASVKDGASSWTQGGSWITIGIYRDEGRPTTQKQAATSVNWYRIGNVLTFIDSNKHRLRAGDLINLWNVVSSGEVQVNVSYVLDDYRFQVTVEPTVETNFSGDTAAYQPTLSTNFYETYRVFRLLPSFRLLTVLELNQIFAATAPLITLQTRSLYNVTTGTYLND